MNKIGQIYFKNIFWNNSILVKSSLSFFILKDHALARLDVEARAIGLSTHNNNKTVP
jgi:hypothetical protein